MGIVSLLCMFFLPTTHKIHCIFINTSQPLSLNFYIYMLASYYTVYFTVLCLTGCLFSHLDTRHLSPILPMFFLAFTEPTSSKLQVLLSPPPILVTISIHQSLSRFEKFDLDLLDICQYDMGLEKLNCCKASIFELKRIGR